MGQQGIQVTPYIGPSVSLAGGSATLYLMDPAGNKTNHSMTIDSTGMYPYYTTQSGDFGVPGDWEAEVKGILSGVVVWSDIFQIKVKANIS